MSDNEVTDEYIDGLINYAKDMEENVIPVNSHGFVPNEFIDFFLKCSLEEFINHFKLFLYFPEQLQDEEEMKGIRTEAEVAINSVIALKNRDYYMHTIFSAYNVNSVAWTANGKDANSIFHLLEITKQLGFKIIRKELVESIKDVSHEDIQNDLDSSIPMNKVYIANRDYQGNQGYSEINKEHDYYLYNEEHGFLWIIKTHNDHFVLSSELYGNIQYRDNGTVFSFESAYVLPHSDIYAVAIDMSRLPIYTYESIISSFRPVKNWMIVPPIDEDEYQRLKRITDYNSVAREQMFKSIIERHDISEYIINNNTIEQYKDFLNTDSSLKKEIYLTEIFFDCYANPSWRLNYLDKKGIKEDELFLHGLNHVALYRTKNRLKDISDHEIMQYLSLFDKKEFLHIANKKDDLIETYDISEDILDFIELKATHDFH